MADNVAPSRNPANEGDLSGMLAEILPKFIGGVDDMLPCMVQAFEAGPPARVKVKPLIKILKSQTGELIERESIESLPVFQLGGGGYVINFNNISAGDLGWIKANDRDISLFLQSYEESGPNTKRRQKFSDAVFIPDVMRGYEVENGAHFVIQAIDGKKRVAFKDDRIKIICDHVVDIEAASEVNIGVNVNLGSGGPFIAREGDEVEVTIPSGTFLVSATAGVPNPSPVTVPGVITSASTKHTAS